MSEGFAPASTLETAVDDPMVGRQLGPNLVLAKMASGGMAEIFLATQKGSLGVSRLVVVKRILPSLAESEQFRSMFYDEARIAAQLEHPNIIRVEDFGEDPSDGSLYMVMEYVEGVPLLDSLKRAAKAKQPVDVRWAATVVAQAAEGLHHAHELTRNDGSESSLGLVHRDVSPHNILVTPNGIVKVFDFGIAKAMDRVTQTAAGVIKGKFAYMSPEQARGYAVDRRSDVFSLGIVLWETLTLKRLFSRGNDLDTYRALLEAQVPRATQLRSDVFPELDDVLAYALAREPDGRFATARAFGQAVTHAISRHGGLISNALVGEPIRQHFGDQLAARKKLAARRMTMPPQGPPGKSTNPGLRRIEDIQIPGIGLVPTATPPPRAPSPSGPEAVIGPGGLIEPFMSGRVSSEQVVTRPSSGERPAVASTMPGYMSARSGPSGPDDESTAMVRGPSIERGHGQGGAGPGAGSAGSPADRGVIIEQGQHAEADEITKPPMPLPTLPKPAPAGLTKTQKIVAAVVVSLLVAGVVAAMLSN